MKDSDESLARFGVAIPRSLLEQFDEKIESASMPNRSAALRNIIREYVSKDTWQNESGSVYGTITLTYDHHSNDATSRLTDIQHDFGSEIVCTTHVHADHNHCLEVIIVKGDAGRIKDFITALSSLKAIMSIQPVIATI